MEREALKLALEALKRIKTYGDVFLSRSHEQKPYDQVCEAIEVAEKALAQPAQEPVAKYSDIVSDGGLDPRNTTLPQRPWLEPTGNEWFEWWRVSKVADETEAEIDFADFLIIAQAVVAKLKEKNT